MNRADLERLDRDELIARAEGVGVTRARVLTRLELVDELILRSDADRFEKERSRGFFGRARDLLARVVERGLNLPDAAERIRALGGPPPAFRPSAPAILPTVTLAEIYAAQGHRDRAVETLERVLMREPDHAAAQSLLGLLRNASYAVPEPRLPPEKDVEEQAADAVEQGRTIESEPVAASAPLTESVAPGGGEALEADECVAVPIDATTTYVHWSVAAHTLREMAGAGAARAVVRVLIVVPTWEGPQSHVRDHDVSGRLGEIVVRDLPERAVVRVAIGLRRGDAFVPIAHSPALSAAAHARWPHGADALVRWTFGGVRPLSPDDRDAPSIDRALSRAKFAPLSAEDA